MDGDTSMLTRQAMSQLLNAKALVRASNIKDVRNFIGDLQTSTSILSPHGGNILESSGEQSAILAGIESKLPYPILRKWLEQKEKIEEHSNIPNLKNCILILEKHLVLQEKIAFITIDAALQSKGKNSRNEDLKRSNTNAITPSIKEQSFYNSLDHSQDEQKNFPKACLFCKQHNHNARFCTSPLTENEKKKILKKVGACWHCPEICNHRSYKCERKRICKTCKEKGRRFFDHHWNIPQRRHTTGPTK